MRHKGCKFSWRAQQELPIDTTRLGRETSYVHIHTFSHTEIKPSKRLHTHVRVSCLHAPIQTNIADKVSRTTFTLPSPYKQSDEYTRKHSNTLRAISNTKSLNNTKQVKGNGTHVTPFNDVIHPHNVIFYFYRLSHSKNGTQTNTQRRSELCILYTST